MDFLLLLVIFLIIANIFLYISYITESSIFFKNNVYEKICPKGHYCSIKNLDLPKKCPIGSYCPHDGMNYWIKCSKGFYCPQEGMSTLHRPKRKMRQTFCKKNKNLLFSFSIV